MTGKDEIKFSETLVYSRRWFFTKAEVSRVIGQRYLTFSNNEKISCVYPERYKIVVLQNPGTVNEHIYEIHYTGSMSRAIIWADYKRRELWRSLYNILTIRGLVAYCYCSLFSNTGYFKRYK